MAPGGKGVVLFLPRNTNLQQLADTVPEGQARGLRLLLVCQFALCIIMVAESTNLRQLADTVPEGQARGLRCFLVIWRTFVSVSVTDCVDIAPSSNLSVRHKCGT